MRVTCQKSELISCHSSGRVQHWTGCCGRFHRQEVPQRQKTHGLHDAASMF